MGSTVSPYTISLTKKKKKMALFSRNQIQLFLVLLASAGYVYNLEVNALKPWRLPQIFSVSKENQARRRALKIIQIEDTSIPSFSKAREVLMEKIATLEGLIERGHHKVP